MPGLTLDLKPQSSLTLRLLDAVRDRVRFSKTEMNKKQKQWIQAEESALAYIPERDVDAARRSKREGGQPQYTTITLPYSYGVLMASHTYWTTVFLSRSPIFQYTARHGEGQQQVQALEALIDYQLNVGQMLVPLYIWLMDVGKYGFGVLGTFWDEREEIVAEIKETPQSILGIPTGKTKKEKVTRRIPGYHGNRIYNVRPFDWYPDPRVPLARFQEGEFVAVYQELGWNVILLRADQGMYTQEALKKLKARGRQGSTMRVAGSGQLELPSTDSVFEHFTEKRASDTIKIYECYVDLVPDAWGLGSGKLPEKWVFTVTDDFEILLGAQPLGAYHNTFPFDIIEYEPEGYALINRGIPEIMKPVQDTVDWLINSHFYNVRKTLNNQFILDPSRVVLKDVLDPLPGGVIRLKPAAYGSDINTVIQQLQSVDITRAHLSDMELMNSVGERASGVNDQIMGIIEPRGRRTAQESRITAASSTNRLKTTSEYMSAMGFAPMSQRFVQNSQQYYDLERKFRIVGDLSLTAGPQFAQVTPDAIAGFYDFVPVDGTLPVDRFAQAQLWRALLGEMRQFPEILAQYDVGRIFAWVAQLAGLKNINQFKIQLGDLGQLQQEAQRGNVVAMPSAQRDLTRVPEPGQLEGLGTTA